jgi:hypothetical protein
MNAVLTIHAQEVLEKRCIPLEWVKRAVTAPALRRPDPIDPALEQRFVKIPEHGDRVMKVVVNKLTSPERVVSVYFDRRMKGIL